MPGVDQRLDPAEPGAGDQGDRQERRQGDTADQRALSEQVGPPAALASGPDDHQERQGQAGGRLDRHGHRDQHHARHQVPVQGQDEPGQHGPDHQRLVVAAGDEMEQQQGLSTDSQSAATGSMPQRRASRGVAQTIIATPSNSTRRCTSTPAITCSPVIDTTPAHDQQEPGTVRGGGVLPPSVDLVGERVVVAERLHRPLFVRVAAVQHLGADRQVAVDVPGEDRWGHQERHGPHGQRVGQLGPGQPAAPPGHGQSADQEPTHDQQPDAGIGQGQRRGSRPGRADRGSGCRRPGWGPGSRRRRTRSTRRPSTARRRCPSGGAGRAGRSRRR